ncbi:MAG: FliG C-terminal domain-containing protein [Isosphaeraceae bacterium]
MTTGRPDMYPAHPAITGSTDPRMAGGTSDDPEARGGWGTDGPVEPSALRKAAIVLVSLEQSLAAQLLSHLDRAAVESVTWEIARLDRVDPEERALALEEFYELGLRRLCFVFDDVVKLSDTDLRAGFRGEDIETWALALAGASAAVRGRVLGALPVSAAEALRTQLENLGPFRLSDSEAAQLEVAERLRRLHDRGWISLPEPTGHEEVLV